MDKLKNKRNKNKYGNKKYKPVRGGGGDLYGDAEQGS